MGNLSFLTAVVIAFFFPIFQTSSSLDVVNPIMTDGVDGRNIYGVRKQVRETVFHLENSEVGSGHRDGDESLGANENEPESAEKHRGSEITLAPRPAFSPHYLGVENGGDDEVKAADRRNIHSTHSLKEESWLKESLESTGMYSTDSQKSRHPIQISDFPLEPVHTLSEAGSPCAVGEVPCRTITNFGGTKLLWKDMRRTLAFAWDLHVYGCASLFIVMAALAALGLVGTRSLPHPLCAVLTLSNGLLMACGALRATLLLLDPYGTRQVLPLATLTALHNAPSLVLLWAQVILAVVTLRDLKCLCFSLKLQYPWVFGCCSALHCTILFVADLYLSKVSSVVSLLLHTLSLCLAVPFLFGTLVQALSDLQPFARSPVPQWISSQRTERLGKRVIAVCAALGVLCCSLQMYSLLWLHELLGNWRRFSWGWWIAQFWARNLELAWGFSLVFLGSWVFWRPPRGRSNEGRGDGKSLLQKILARLQKDLFRNPETSLEDLIPNNWAKHKMSKTGVTNTTMWPYDEEPATDVSNYNHDPHTSSCSDPQSGLFWQRVGERECVLSLIEFDMRPPSPINLRRSIDAELYRGQLAAGGLFTPPPPLWTHAMSGERDSSLTAFPPAYAGCGWTVDTESLSASLDHFQAVSSIPECNASIGSPTMAQRIHLADWLEDDVTNL